MYRSTIQALTTIFLLILMVASGHAQTALYSFTFDEGLDGWTPEGISSSDPAKNDSALWVWTPNGDAPNGAFNTANLPIASPSEGGAIVFDSDGYDNGGDSDPDATGTGPVPAPQRGEITSPALDFSMETKVILSFYQYYRYFSKDDDDFETPASSVEVSGDGGQTWTSFVLNEDISPNSSTRTTDVVALDITDIAAGQADVRVKFVWDGNYYFWIIDDVALYNERGADLAVTAFTNINNFETPDFALIEDTVDLEMMFANHGDETVTDTIMVWTRVLDIDREVVFSDTGYITDPVEVNDTMWYDFENWVPGELAQNSDDDNYAVVYNVRIKGDTMPEVVKPDDNVDFQGFLVRDLTLRKVPGGDGIGFNGNGANGLEDFTWANIFELPSSFTENLKISRVNFDAFSTDRTNDPLSGKFVVIYVINLGPDAVAMGDTLLLDEIRDGFIDLINFDVTGTIDELAADSEKAVGVGSYQFTVEDDSRQEPFSAEVTDFDGENPVILEPGNQYMVAIDYTNDANSIAQEVSESYPLYQVSSLAHYPSLGSGNSFVVLSSPDRNYARNIAAISLDLEFSNPVDETPLPENAVKIFPNPINEVMNVEIEFENPTQTTIFLADASGRILMSDVKKNLVRENISYDMTRYPSGTYIVRVSTKEGTKTEHVVVTH